MTDGKKQMETGNNEAIVVTPRKTKNQPPAPVAQGVPMSKFVKRSLKRTPEMVMIRQDRTVAAEKFRRLRTLIKGREDQRIIVVTSAAPSEGKSTVALNVALGLASDSANRTLLLDADLRRPTVARWIKPAPSIGFTECLVGSATLEHALVTLEDSPLHVLPAGSSEQDPIELLATEKCRDFIEELRERYDHVIIDTPPVVPFTDADTLATYADGVLLVVRAGTTLRRTFEAATRAVSGAPILGAVLNDFAPNLADGVRDYDNYYYDEYYSRDRRP